MDEQKTAREKLERIRQLSFELERLEEETPEYEIVARKNHLCPLSIKR